MMYAVPPVTYGIIGVMPIPVLYLGPIEAILNSLERCMWDMICCIIFTPLGIYVYYDYQLPSWTTPWDLLSIVI